MEGQYLTHNTQINNLLTIIRMDTSNIPQIMERLLQFLYLLGGRLGTTEGFYIGNVSLYTVHVLGLLLVKGCSFFLRAWRGG